MFRRLYWITERLDADGRSHAVGVYSSLPDLVRKGLRSLTPDSVRLSLVKVDASEGPLGVWSGPEFDGLREGLDAYVRTEEFTREQIDELLKTLQK